MTTQKLHTAPSNTTEAATCYIESEPCCISIWGCFPDPLAGNRTWTERFINNRKALPGRAAILLPPTNGFTQEQQLQTYHRIYDSCEVQVVAKRLLTV